MAMSDHRKLMVWQEAMDLVEKIYQVTRGFPRDERFGLVSQMRRSAVSIPSNIAEGASRKNKNEFIQFLSIARGSLAELRTQVEISHRLDFTHDDLSPKLDRVGRLLNALIRSLRVEK